MDDEYTTISVKASTRDRFIKIGTRDMTNDDVLNALMDYWLRYKGVTDRAR